MKKKFLQTELPEITHHGLGLFFEYIEAQFAGKKELKDHIIEIRFPAEQPTISAEPVYIATNYGELQQSDIEHITCVEYADKSEVFRQLTTGLQILIEKNGYGYICPEATAKRLKRTPKKDKEALIEQTGYFSDVISLKAPKTPDSAASQVLLMYLITPLTINRVTDEAYYSLYLSLFFPINAKPETLPKRQREEYWKELLTEYLTRTRGNSRKSDKSPDTQSKISSKNNALVRVSLHSQLQKQGRGHQLSLMDVLQEESDILRRESLERKIYDNRIEAVGIDLTLSQEKALFAVQKLLTATEYKGTEKKTAVLDGKNPFLYTGHIPIIKFQTAEYLEAYGVTKFKSGRGKMEYSAGVRTEALSALRELADKRFLLCYTRKYWVESEKGKKQERYDVVRTITPLIQIVEGYEALTKSQSELVTKGGNSPDTDERLSVIAVEPNPILVDQLDTYFVLKPANCYQEIQLKFGKTSKYVYRFIDFLITEAAHRERRGVQNGEEWVIQRNWHMLAQVLRMDSWLKSRQWKAIRGSLDKSYAIAKELGYLLAYESGVEGKTKEIDRLHLNPDKFRHVQEVEKRRQEIEAGA